MRPKRAYIELTRCFCPGLRVDETRARVWLPFALEWARGACVSRLFIGLAARGA